LSRLAEYYQQRAAEYDAIYAKPERQEELAWLRTELPGLVRGRNVLEVAAGTGYWTQVLAPAARTVTATDLNDGPLRIARQRDYGQAEVAFTLADAFDLNEVGGDFDAVFAGFFWSHVPLDQLPRFSQGLHERIGSGGSAIILDNRYVEGSSSPVTRTDDGGNTYQRRRLDDGREFDVLKNFPDEETFIATVQPWANDVRWIERPYFWLAVLTFR
jgi:protein-L-isoaspartate O-methyltransferase